MKKFLLMSLGLVLLLGAAKASFAAAPGTAEVYIHVTVISGTVSVARISTDNIFLGQVLVNSQTSTPELQFQNDSTDTTEDFSVSLSGTGWTFQSDAPGSLPFAAINQARLSALWVATGTTPAVGDFLADDTITTTAVESSATVYARPGDADTDKGFNVPHSVLRDRYMVMLFDAPNTGSANQGSEVVITVIVTASIH